MRFIFIKSMAAVVVAFVVSVLLCLPLSAQAQSTPPPVGSTITVKNTKYSVWQYSVNLNNSEEEPYVFKGSVDKISSYSNFTFFYGETQYGYDSYYSTTSFPEKIELKKGGKADLHLEIGQDFEDVNIVATLSEDYNTLTVRFLQVSPTSIVVNGEEHLLCDDINGFTGDRLDYASAVTVQEGGNATVSVKIRDKIYGVADNGISFDADNRNMQELSAVLVENASAVSLSQKGVYSVAVLINADGTRSLSITKAASDNEMIFGEGNNLVLDKETGIWSGAATLSGNQELPSFVLTKYNSDGTSSSETYWFASDIDDVKGAEHSVSLTKSEPTKKAKCVTAGTYKLTVNIADDGTAMATYINTTPPVEIKDLYVCVYDKHYVNGEYGYNKGDSFSYDYKVTYQLPDGSYAIALYMNSWQTFYIMNNGIAYRPAVVDMTTPFGKGVDDQAVFTFSPSDDHSLRKYVTDIGYRMFIIRPNGKNIDVSGYVLSNKNGVTTDRMMNIVESLAAPEEHGHMADVIIKFTDPENKGYRTDYAKMKLNPSGTHALYKLQLKAGQTFEIYRGRAIYDTDGVTIIGIEDKDKVQYGCKKLPGEGASSVTITDGDISDLKDPYNGDYNTTTYSVARDGEFTFLAFYTTVTKQFTISRKVLKDRGIKIAVYDGNHNQVGDYIDMQYKNVNRRNLMTVVIPEGGYAKFGFMEDNEFTPFSYYNLGLSNEVGYDTEPEDPNKQDSQFDAEKEGWYRFRIRLREDGKYYLSYQEIPMPDKVYLYVTSGAETFPYEASSDGNGHYVFTGVTLKSGDEYYFVNTKDGKIGDDTSGGLIWYCAHSSSNGKLAEGNPVLAGRDINMFSHLNVGTDYADGTFSKFKYSQERTLENIEIDMCISSMSHRFSCDYTGQIYYFEGCCVGVQSDNELGWSKKNPDYKFEYHPSTGYYTCFLDYLWGDWFIYNYDEGGAQGTMFYAFNLNNVVHELNHPYYLSSDTERYVSDAKVELPTGTAANTEIEDAKTPGTYKDRFMISMAPGAVGIIQSVYFQHDWTHSPVYKDVTVVFDPANNVLWLESGHAEGEPDIEDPYGELYLVFTDVSPEEWKESRADDPDPTGVESVVVGKHWVKLQRDPNQMGRYTAQGVKFPARKTDDGAARHASYFFSNRLGATLAETIRYSNNYHAGTTDPDYVDDMYGSVFTRLNYNEAGYNGYGSFLTDKEPMTLATPAETAYATTVFVRRWDDVESAPFEDCILSDDEEQTTQEAPSRAAVYRADENAGATAGDPVYVTLTDKIPDELKQGDQVVRTFSSEPYTYDVVVHLGRKEFTLETAPKEVQTSVELLPAGDETRSTAVISAAAGHISVTGAKSVSIYTITGGCLLRDASCAELDVAPGVYIVVADGHASKHIL